MSTPRVRKTTGRSGGVGGRGIVLLLASKGLECQGGRANWTGDPGVDTDRKFTYVRLVWYRSTDVLPTDLPTDLPVCLSIYI